MEEFIKELAEEVIELSAGSENSRRKEAWIRHNNLNGHGKVLINIHLRRIVSRGVWDEIIPEHEIMSSVPEHRFVERQLRQKLFKYKEIDDDDVILPTIWVGPVIKYDEELFGIKPQVDIPDDVKGSKKFRSIISSIDDINKLKKPDRVLDREKTSDKVSIIREITGDFLPVKVLLPELGTSPFEIVAQYRSMDDLLFDFYDDPGLIHEMMDFFTDCIINDYKRLEVLYGIDPESTWDFRIHYDRLENEDKPCTLENCWAYISAQSAAGISPDMFEEFIQPYHERIAEIFGKVYYHGCEDLTQKAGIIANLTNLMRFHISPWSNVDSILDQLDNRFVYETHVHPSNHLFIFDGRQIKQDIKQLASKCIQRGVTADINLSDIETIHNDKNKLIKWAKLAREAVSDCEE